MAKAPEARSRILEAAGALFADKGFEAVAVADIAAGAGVSTGLVYYHFTDKRHLYESVVGEGLHLLEEVAVQTFGGAGAPAARLASFTVLMRSMLTIDRLHSVIGEGVESGEFREIDPHLAATAVFALVNTLVTARALDTPVGQGLDGDTAAQAAFMSGLFFRGVARTA